VSLLCVEGAGSYEGKEGLGWEAGEGRRGVSSLRRGSW
jgi:hypothetical protein